MINSKIGEGAVVETILDSIGMSDKQMAAPAVPVARRGAS
jgi:hypothetical protein